jgi:hypothetical protein
MVFGTVFFVVLFAGGALGASGALGVSTGFGMLFGASTGAAGVAAGATVAGAAAGPEQPPHVAAGADAQEDSHAGAGQQLLSRIFMRALSLASKLPLNNGVPHAGLQLDSHAGAGQAGAGAGHAGAASQDDAQLRSTFKRALSLASKFPLNNGVPHAGLQLTSQLGAGAGAAQPPQSPPAM